MQKRKDHNLINLFRHENWNIGIASRPIASFIKDQSVNDIQWLKKTSGESFIADPFGFWDKGLLHVYAEEFNYKENKGNILRIVINGGWDILNQDTALSMDTHISYPYIIEDKGSFYCVPEMSVNNTVALYQIDVESGHMREKAVLLTGRRLSDPTVIQFNGHWWLFGDSGDFNLCAWYSDDLFGPWVSHSKNPLKVDIASARPGGTPFVHEGDLYRPSQDCSKTYGGRVLLNKVKTLTPTEFSEETVSVIEPDPGSVYPAGIHTLTSVGDITLVDGKRWTFIPQVFLGKILRNLGNFEKKRER